MEAMHAHCHPHTQAPFCQGWRILIASGKMAISFLISMGKGLPQMMGQSVSQSQKMMMVNQKLRRKVKRMWKQRRVKNVRLGNFSLNGWLVGRSWLKHNGVRNVMICKYCEQFDKMTQSSLPQGSSTFKLETLLIHEVSEIHLTCQKAHAASLMPPASTPIEKGFQKMDNIELL